MPPLKVTPLAFESLGVRSSAISIESDDLKIVIDPAVALAPTRFGLSPHPVEEQAKASLWGEVRKNALAADVLVVTHYHYDHVEPKEPEIYAGKTVVLKHLSRMINPSQKGGLHPSSGASKRPPERFYTRTTGATVSSKRR